MVFNDDVIERLIELTKKGRLVWENLGCNYYSLINDTKIYFYEGYMDSSSQSKDLKLNIGDKCMKTTLYSYKEENACKLIQLGNAIRQSLTNVKIYSELKINEEVLISLDK